MIAKSWQTEGLGGWDKVKRGPGDILNRFGARKLEGGGGVVIKEIETMPFCQFVLIL